MPDVIPQKQATAGFVFTHREGGLKLFEVGFETDRQMLRFRFVLPVGGSSYAIEKVDFGSIYPQGTVEAVDLVALREKLAQLHCCTTNKAGNVNGDPLNIVVVGRGIDALFAFIERGWRLDEPFDLHSTYRTIRAFLFGSEYFNAPVSPLYVLGANRMSHCRRRATPSASEIIYGCGWRRSRLTGFRCGLARSAVTSASS